MTERFIASIKNTYIIVMALRCPARLLRAANNA
jgi:hypothetical protein